MFQIGIVAIGRNEGERLRRCLQSVISHPTIYVDSGSSDGSVEMARSLGDGVEVVELDRDIPFTAARARNAGFQRLQQLHPETEFVFFVDSDCEVAIDWLHQAATALQTHPDVALVCGRRRERHPNASIYNQLCDMEWDTPIGEATECGGDVMIAVKAFTQVNGYNPSIIAGEEPELCVRLRQRNWRILRLDAEMTLHDAAMTRFSQWWKRSIRSGHAFAQGSAMHGKSPQRHWTRQTRSNWFWGLLIPLLALTLAWPTHGLSLLLLLGYPVLAWRIHRHTKRRNYPAPKLYTFFCVLAKFPQVWGQFRYHWSQLRSTPTKLIEYKNH